MVVIIKNGTHRNIPATPQIVPHNARLKRITTGLRFREVPINLGSIIFPMVICNAPIQNSTIKNREKPSELDCANAMVAGKTVAIIEPTVGIKLSIKIKVPQISGKSTPNKLSTK